MCSSKKLIRLCFVGIVGVLLTQSSTAVAAPDFKIAYVDMQQALAESRAGGKARKEYEAEVKNAQVELDKKKEAFQAKSEAFQKQRSSLSEDSLSQKQEELLQMERDLKRNFQDLEQKLRRRNGQIVGELIKELRQAVHQVGEAKGYSMIVERGSEAVLYVDKAHDITPDVVKVFDSLTK